MLGANSKGALLTVTPKGPKNMFNLYDYSNYRSSNYMSSTVILFHVNFIGLIFVLCDGVTIQRVFNVIAGTAKLLKSNTGSFCWIGIQYPMPYSKKYTPPYCFFYKFAGWDMLSISRINVFFIRTSWLGVAVLVMFLNMFLSSWLSIRCYGD